MVKGVNRNVIEISDTGSELFERALFFVRPEKGGENPAHLEQSAMGLLRRVTMRRRILNKNKAAAIRMGYLLALAVGAVASYLIFAI